MLDQDKANFGTINMTETNSIIAVGIQDFSQKFLSITDDIGAFNVYLREQRGNIFAPNVTRIPMVDCREIMPYTYANKSLLFSEAY